MNGCIPVLALKIHSAPAGPRLVATGAAQRNPWKRRCFLDPAPKGQRSPSPGIERPSPLPGQARKSKPPSTGCAALHPWLQPSAPLGPNTVLLPSALLEPREPSKQKLECTRDEPSPCVHL